MIFRYHIPSEPAHRWTRLAAQGSAHLPAVQPVWLHTVRGASAAERSGPTNWRHELAPVSTLLTPLGLLSAVQTRFDSTYAAEALPVIALVDRGGTRLSENSLCASAPTLLLRVHHAMPARLSIPEGPETALIIDRVGPTIWRSLPPLAQVPTASHARSSRRRSTRRTLVHLRCAPRYRYHFPLSTSALSRFSGLFPTRARKRRDAPVARHISRLESYARAPAKLSCPPHHREMVSGDDLVS